MLGLATSKTSSSLLQGCKKYFSEKGWRVSVGSGQQDFELETKDLKLRLICVDQSLMSYQSPSAAVENMGSISRNRRTWIPVVFVLNFEFPVDSYEILLDRGIIAISENQLELIGNLPTKILNPGDGFMPRQIAILSQNSWACLSISKSYKLSGNRMNTLIWAKRAIKPGDPVGPAYQVVFNTLVSEGDIDAAYDLATDAVLRRNEDQFFLRALIKISEQRGDKKATTHWSQLLSKAEVKCDGYLDSIFKSTKNGPKNEFADKSTKANGILTRWLRIRN